MTLGERSHGKARPRLVRSSDLTPLTDTATAEQPPRQRDASGRFASGNAVGIGRGAKAAVRRLLGRGTAIDDPEALAVARDADTLYCATLRELPSDGSTVRQLVALFARHTALAAYWSAKASTVGLGSDEGVAAADHATKHGTRAERLSVTMLDVSRTLAAKRDADAPFDPLAKYRRPA